MSLLQLDPSHWLPSHDFILTSVGCAVGPRLPRPQLIFPSKTGIFRAYLNFQQLKSLGNQYLPHSESKSYQINSIKSYSSRSFQQHQRHIQNSSEIFQLWFNLIFSEEIIQYPRTFAPQVQCHETKPMHPSPQELSKDTKNTIWSIPGRWISLVQTKQNKTNKLPSFIDRC
jgi:hypothetical protein